MGFSLFHILESAILLMNMFAILNERRFLRKIGWHTTSIGTISENESKISVFKSQIVLIMYAMRNFFKCIFNKQKSIKI